MTPEFLIWSFSEPAFRSAIGFRNSFSFSARLFISGLSFFFGGGIFCTYGLSLARANDEITDKTKSVQVARALLFSYSFASLFSPLLMSYAMKIFGAFGFIYVYLVLYVGLILFALTQKTIPQHMRKEYNDRLVARTAGIATIQQNGNFADRENKK